MHPFDVLVAHRTYLSGRSGRGNQTWQPSRPIVEALDSGFGAVEPTGRRLLLALDAADSPIRGMPLSCLEATAALALVTAATEPRCGIVGLADPSGLTPRSIRPRTRLDKAIRAIPKLRWRFPNCSAPIRHALDEGLEVDTFVVYTDYKTWSGETPLHHQLSAYRRRPVSMRR